MRLLLTVFALIGFLSPQLLWAQFNAVTNDVSLEVQPQFPDPNTDVTIRVNDFALGTGSGAITWIIDGAEVPTVANERAITVPVGAIGETTTVSARLTLASGQAITVSESITPASVAIILEPQTEAPYWYRGRPLPSVGSTVRAIALPNVGSTQPAETYTYTWRLGSEVLNGGPVFGQHITSFTTSYGRQVPLTVTVSDETGQAIARRSVSVPNVEPAVHFYALNPLRGQSRLAQPDTFALVGSELTLRAEPFHIDTNLPPANTLFEWKVNGRTVDNPSTDQYAITLRNDGGQGRFAVDFHVRNLDELLQGARGDFNISF